MLVAQGKDQDLRHGARDRIFFHVSYHHFEAVDAHSKALFAISDTHAKWYVCANGALHQVHAKPIKFVCERKARPKTTTK